MPDARPRLLDLFCGGGGAGAGYHAAGFDVVGVDLVDQPDYPYPLLQLDALEALRDAELVGRFDAIHASPPCQRYSHVTPAARREEHPDLVPIVRDLLRATGLPWVMENVPGAPMLNPITVCGDSLRLGVRRHRLFESNVLLAGTPCYHDRPEPAVPVYGTRGQRTSTGHATAAAGRTAMGVPWLPWAALTQAVPPAYTHWLGVQLAASSAVTQRRRRPSVAFSQVSDATAQGGYVTTSSPIRHRAAGVCGYCLAELTRAATGRWPLYCCQACRQAAYRHRHAQTPPPAPADHPGHDSAARADV